MSFDDSFYSIMPFQERLVAESDPLSDSISHWYNTYIWKENSSGSIIHFIKLIFKMANWSLSLCDKKTRKICSDLPYILHLIG